MEQYTVTGMSCAACSARVEKAVSKVPGVTACSVSLLTNSMGVEGTASSGEIIAAVEKAGYGASLKSAGSGAGAGTGANPAANAGAGSAEDALKDRETPVLLRRLIASAIFLAALMYLSMGHMMGAPLPGFLADNPLSMGLAQLLLTGIIMVINQKFFISGAKSLWRRAPNMDALVAVGSAAAFGYSAFALFAMSAAQLRGDAEAVMGYLHEFYFESAGTILTLITLGKLLEARSKGKTTDALKGLMKLSPKTARLIREGAEVTVPVEQVQIGDVFAVRPGESVPVDGTVLEGDSAVDESALTGESIPVDKAAGSAVSAGTLNQSGYLRCRATRVGQDTTLSQIIRMVSDAAATKAPIAKAADKVAGVFVPAVMAVAALTVAVWLIVGESVGFSLARGISVLVISCPCALGLATPVAVMVGSGVGARNGILFKTAASLELTGRAKTVALDKTGTVTEGRPRVTDILPAEGYSETDLLNLAAALEARSEHPLARAVMQKAGEEEITPEEVREFKALPGNGLIAKGVSATLAGGNLSFIAGQTEIPDVVQNQAEKLSMEGKTPLFFAENGHLAGIIAVADGIKADSPEAVRALREMGVTVVMITGDNARTAEAIGKQAGVDRVIAGVLPDGKERAVRELAAGGKVIMVGDGINDAPALTAADVGIAIGAGADVAIDAADVVLMKNRLSDVPAAIRLSRATLRNIHENLFWAFIYNTLGIPLAAGVFIRLLGWSLNPMFAAAAMSLSSFCVVTNALRLNFVKIRGKKAQNEINGNSGSQNPVANTNKEEKIMKKTLKIEGMMCGHCEARVKKALEALDGVAGAEVSHEKGTAVVTLSADVPDAVLKKAVEDQDYTVKEIA